jgi:hypothetical protein
MPVMHMNDIWFEIIILAATLRAAARFQIEIEMSKSFMPLVEAQQLHLLALAQ